ncbi:MAG: hypothetical protein D6701_11240, partial [Gemmatimonadetes bacterium]
MSGRTLTRGLSIVLAAAAAGCELADVSLAPPDDVIVAEVYVIQDEHGARATAFVHRTLGGTPGRPPDPVVALRSGGGEVLLREALRADCVRADTTATIAGRCLVTGAGENDRALAAVLNAGEVEAEVRVGSVRLRGRLRLPEPFRLVQPQASACRL